MHDENKPTCNKLENESCNNEVKTQVSPNSHDSVEVSHCAENITEPRNIEAITNGIEKLITVTNECVTNEISNQNGLVAQTVVENGVQATCTTHRKPPRLQNQTNAENINSSNTGQDGGSGECLDSTGVDVLEFLRMTLQNSHKDRAILLRFEHEMIEFINNKMIDFMKFSAMTSYHRMLLHRVAAYFGMDHNVDETGKCVIVNKIQATKIPEFRFGEYISDCNLNQNNDDLRRRSILKRSNQSKSFDHGQSGRNDWRDNRQRSFEEREENYEKIRARIFNATQEANSSSKLSSSCIVTTTTLLTNGTVTPACTKSPTTPRVRPAITVLPRSSSATCLTDHSAQKSPILALHTIQTSSSYTIVPKPACRTSHVSTNNGNTSYTIPATGYKPTQPPQNKEGYSSREHRIPTFNDYQYNGAPPVSVDHQPFPPQYHGNAPPSNMMYAPYNEYHIYPLHPPSGVILPPSVQQTLHNNNDIISQPYHRHSNHVYPPNNNHHGDVKTNKAYMPTKHRHDNPPISNGCYKTFMHQHGTHAPQVYPVYTQPNNNRPSNTRQEVPLMYLPATNSHAPSYCLYSQFHTSPQNPQIGMQEIPNGTAPHSRRDY